MARAAQGIGHGTFTPPGFGGGGDGLAIPYGADEPRWEDAAAQLFEDDFSGYSSTAEMITSGGGRWLQTQSAGNQLAIGEGYNEVTGATEGNAWRADFTQSSGQPNIGIEGPWNSLVNWSSARVQRLRYNWRGDSRFTITGSNGKKHFEIVNTSDQNRITNNASGFSLAQTGPGPWDWGVSSDGKIDASTLGDGVPHDGGFYDDYIIANTGDYVADMNNFMENYLCDEAWHRFTHELTRESTNGAHDGRYRIWIDGHLVLDRPNLGTGQAQMLVMRFATVWNEGPAQDCTEWFTNAKIWR